MKNIIIIMVLTFIISCNNNSTPLSIYKNANKYRLDGNLKDAINNYKILIEKYKKDSLAAESQFQIADIFLNDVKDYELAISEFKKVLESYSDYSVSKKSLFMIAYINNNYINSYSEAFKYYNLFIEKYPNDELIPSVNYELNGLNKLQNEIDSLNNVINHKENI